MCSLICASGFEPCQSSVANEVSEHVWLRFKFGPTHSQGTIIERPFCRSRADEPVSDITDLVNCISLAVHDRSSTGFIGEVKDHDDVEVFEVTRSNRDTLPATLATRFKRVVTG